MSPRERLTARAPGLNQTNVAADRRSRLLICNLSDMPGLTLAPDVTHTQTTGM